MSSNSSGDKNSQISAVRKNIENAIEMAEEDRIRKLLSKRLEIARTGLGAYQRGDVAEAVKLFHTYLRILEETKDVGEGELTPALFDIKKELPELMMLSGIYWDLVKVYDFLKTPDKQRDFHLYLEKYVLFSKGMPYQPLCAESIRKHMNTRKTLHRVAFTNAHQLLAEGKCYIATALVDVIDVETLPTLQNLRDKLLNQYRLGRAFVRFYYQVGPSLARFTHRLPWIVRKLLGLGLDRVAQIYWAYFAG
jgi:hypothetical protein